MQTSLPRTLRQVGQWTLPTSSKRTSVSWSQQILILFWSQSNLAIQLLGEFNNDYMDRYKILLILSKRICRTAHTGRPAVEGMGVNHRRLHVFMPEEFLDRANVISILQKMRGKGMAQGMACRPVGLT
jgi:hypothetical protein